MERPIRNYSTKKGYNLEYTVIGYGEPVLVMHGGHSSCMEELGYRELVERGYSVITPSRPGYGGTSAELGKNISYACEAYVELLDEWSVDQIHVIAISAGGPSGIHLASQYPNRIKSLTLQSAVARRWLTPRDPKYTITKLMFRPSNEKYVWALMRLMNNHFPRQLLASMIPSFSTWPTDKVLQHLNDEARRQFQEMMKRQRSGHGFLIDLDQAQQDLSSALSAVPCPVLILHSVHDAAVPVEHARYANQHLPNAQLCELESWGHLIWLGPDAADMYRKLFHFLEISS
ncbi:alpha/beta fold hydrolase [Paenibacillus puerhi]|uniref:alpha/beta fold hydrolase n=1 Tax=Paenibacillus puerhi TaxID=2692622 RepID=UPI0013567B27|nr:alpha/beta hydrolase [Paenibacillus puerhi]